MPLRGVLSILLVVCYGLAPVGAEESQPADGYALHEWGVFTWSPGNPMANQDYLEEWRSMPSAFIRGFTDPAPVPEPRPDVLPRKPVIWFHGNAPREVQVRVDFADRGRPMIWYPPADLGNGGSSLTWNLTFGPHVEGQLPLSTSVPDDHWLHHLRDAATTRCFVDAGPGPDNQGRFMAIEDFLYYDGVLPMQPAIVVEREPRLRQEATAIRLTNNEAFPIHDVLVIEQRDNGLCISTFTDVVQPGATEVVSVAMPRSDQLATTVAEWQTRLVATGLTPAEATALTTVWHDGFFAQEGLTVVYRVPQATYDRWLPLIANPPPATTVRTGLVALYHMEPERAERVQALIQQLADPATRASANAALTRYGGAAFTELSAAANGSNPVVARQAQAILDRLNAATAAAMAD